MSFSDDQLYMAKAIQLARKGLYTTQPNPRVGCVLVKQGQIVGEGYHLKAGEGHAEVNALQQAGEQARDATAYVSLEPCSHHGKTPPCADALVAAGVSRVVAAMQDPNPQVSGQGLKRLQDAGIETECGILEAEAEKLNPGFIKRMRTGLPYVRIKLAMSLDGRTAMASGESQWITGAAARQDVQRLRARSSVVLTGSGTVIADDPSMNVRISAAQLGTEIAPHQPLRAIIDSELKVPLQRQIFSLPGETWVYSRKAVSADSRQIKVVTCDQHSGKLQLESVLHHLAEHQANEVHVEAGSELCGALLAQQLVDEIVVYMAPHIMGDSAKGLFHLPGLEDMQQRIDLQIEDIRAVGSDWRMIVRPVYK